MEFLKIHFLFLFAIGLLICLQQVDASINYCRTACKAAAAACFAAAGVSMTAIPAALLLSSSAVAGCNSAFMACKMACSTYEKHPEAVKRGYGFMKGKFEKRKSKKTDETKADDVKDNTVVYDDDDDDGIVIVDSKDQAKEVDQTKEKNSDATKRNFGFMRFGRKPKKADEAKANDVKNDTADDDDDDGIVIVDSKDHVKEATSKKE